MCGTRYEGGGLGGFFSLVSRSGQKAQLLLIAFEPVVMKSDIVIFSHLVTTPPSY